MLEYFIEEFEDEVRLICDGDAQDCMSLEEVVERLNEYKRKIKKYEAEPVTAKNEEDNCYDTYYHNNMKQLIEALNRCEYDYANLKHKLEQEKIRLWFNEDFATRLDKAKPSEKDKEKVISEILKTKIFEVKELEVTLNLLKRQYDVALRYSYDVLK